MQITNCNFCSHIIIIRMKVIKDAQILLDKSSSSSVVIPLYNDDIVL